MSYACFLPRVVVSISGGTSHRASSVPSGVSTAQAPESPGSSPLVDRRSAPPAAGVHAMAPSAFPVHLLVFRMALYGHQGVELLTTEPPLLEPVFKRCSNGWGSSHDSTY